MARPDSRWMPLDWADYWKDTGHLSVAEHGAYINLIGAYWVSGCPLDDDAARLQRLSKCTTKEWKAVAPAVTALFYEKDGKLHHKRVDKELARAAAVYAKRKDMMEKINAKRTRQPSTINVHDNRDDERTQSTQRKPSPQSPSHSPNGENHPSDDSGGKRRPPKRATSLPADWTPTQQDIAHAAAKGLDPKTISAIAEHFRDHNTAKGVTSKDWAASWRTWITKHIGWHGTGPWPRDDARKPAGHVQGRASNATAFDQVRVEAGIEPRGRADGSLRTEGGAWPEGIGPGSSGSGPIIDGDYHERSPGPVGGIEGAYAPASRSNSGGHDDADQSLPEETGGLPSGRDPARAEDSADYEPVVARVAGAS